MNAGHNITRAQIKAAKAHARRRGQYLHGMVEQSPAVIAVRKKNKVARNNRRELKVAAWRAKSEQRQSRRTS